MKVLKQTFVQFTPRASEVEDQQELGMRLKPNNKCEPNNFIV